MKGWGYVTSPYHAALFYVMGLHDETRHNKSDLFDFYHDCIRPEGLHAAWHTSGTMQATLLAFNLWNGFTLQNETTSENLFACGDAPFFVEALKLRYPEYLKEMAPQKEKGGPIQEPTL